MSPPADVESNCTSHRYFCRCRCLVWVTNNKVNKLPHYHCCNYCCCCHYYQPATVAWRTKHFLPWWAPWLQTVVETLWCVYKCISLCVSVSKCVCVLFTMCTLFRQPTFLLLFSVFFYPRLQTSLTPVQTDVFTSQEFTANKAVQFSCTHT